VGVVKVQNATLRTNELQFGGFALLHARTEGRSRVPTQSGSEIWAVGGGLRETGGCGDVAGW
jgi:hypothetical protein